MNENDDWILEEYKGISMAGRKWMKLPTNKKLLTQEHRRCHSVAFG